MHSTNDELGASYGCLHTIVTLYGHHNGNFSCIPWIQENKSNKIH